ncbi:MAG: DUF4956 domain-containing protein [Deltaproteobacteria bacterium]|nr:DUF4956 domain-containing protein [Deltaproteobacteria bacterium]
MGDLEQLQQLLGSQAAALSFQAALFSLIAAFLLGQAIAAVYVWTYRGMSYTRSYVQAIALGSIVACMIMLATSTNIAAGIGVAGSLSALRLRIALRDPKDMIFVFAGMAVGIACGLHAFTTALAGTAMFCFAIGSLTMVEFGQRQVFEGLLRFYAPPTAATEAAIGKILDRYAGRFALTTMREVRQGTAMEYAYHLKTRRAGDRVPMVRELEAIEGVDGVTLHYQDAAQEL